MQPLDRRALVNARWLIQLRWVAVVGQLITILFVRFTLGVDLPLPMLLAALGVTALTNLPLAAWYRQRNRTDGEADGLRWPTVLGSVMLLDLVNLTTLLYLTGGLANPFSFFYFVNLGLAAIVLPPRWAWGLHAIAVLCVAGLLCDHRSVAELQSADRWEPVRLTRVCSLAQQGLFVAFAACSSVIVYFTTRLTSELLRREAELRRAELRRARSEKLEALGTLATGAAHELATPLSTIAVVARELERELQGSGAAEELRDDIRVIRAELDRCRAILDGMAAGAGQAVGERPSSVTGVELVEAVLGTLPRRREVAVRWLDASGSSRLTVPLQALSQALRGILQNALEASEDTGLVTLEVHAGRGSVSRGRGADEIEAAGEPSGLPPIDDHAGLGRGPRGLTSFVDLGALVRAIGGGRGAEAVPAGSPGSSWLELAIRDRGQGMSAEVLQRAGEPFFTTKPPGKGMGLGLFLARSLVERSGGTMVIESRIGQGTTVRVRLPAWDEADP